MRAGLLGPIFRSTATDEFHAGMDRADVIALLAARRDDIVHRFGVRSLCLFGSVARSEAGSGLVSKAGGVPGADGAPARPAGGRSRRLRTHTNLRCVKRKKGLSRGRRTGIRSLINPRLMLPLLPGTDTQMSYLQPVELFCIARRAKPRPPDAEHGRSTLSHGEAGASDQTISS